MNTQRVVQNSRRRVPTCSIKEPFTRKQKEAVRGMVELEVIRGDSRSHDLIIASFYDKNPSYIVSNIAIDIT